jgi:hypothetical protein
MQNDIRAQAANYYDLCPDMPADVPFYKSLVSSPRPECWNWVVAQGVFLSRWRSVRAICRRKLEAVGIVATIAERK